MAAFPGTWDSIWCDHLFQLVKELLPNFNVMQLVKHTPEPEDDDSAGAPNIVKSGALGSEPEDDSDSSRAFDTQWIECARSISKQLVVAHTAWLAEQGLIYPAAARTFIFLKFEAAEDMNHFTCRHAHVAF